MKQWYESLFENYATNMTRSAMSTELWENAILLNRRSTAIIL